MRHKTIPIPENIAEFLNYDEQTGKFVWSKSPGPGTCKGSEAGTIVSNGYIQIGFQGKQFRAHRIAWFFITGNDPGEDEIDHKNGNRADNSFENLELATPEDQNRNLGARGYAWDKQKKCFTSQIYRYGKQKSLGTAHCPLLARYIYLDAITDYRETAPSFIARKGVVGRPEPLESCDQLS